MIIDNIGIFKFIILKLINVFNFGITPMLDSAMQTIVKINNNII